MATLLHLLHLRAVHIAYLYAHPVLIRVRP